MSKLLTFEEMTSFENLYAIHQLAKKRKTLKYETLDFEYDFTSQLTMLSDELRAGTYEMSGYHHFTVREPKVRDIYEIIHRDKIVQHMLCENALIPLLSPHFIKHNTACQKGKGTHFALDELKKFLHTSYKSHNNKCSILKCDIKGYFASISHAVLKNMLAKKVECRKVTYYLHHFIDSHHTEGREGFGLPLGNQTSQWFGLFYLSGLDHFIKKELGIKGYVRYMDDFILVHECKDYLWECLAIITSYVENILQLVMNAKSDVHKVKVGFHFSGWKFRIAGGGRIYQTMRRQSKLRYKRRLKEVEYLFGLGKMTFFEVMQVIASYDGHFSYGDAGKLRERVMEGFLG